MRHIHIVEDNDAVRASLSALMGVLGNVTVSTFGSAEAMLAETDMSVPAVVLVDFRMAGMNGLELLTVLSGYTSRFVVIMVTGQGNVTLAVRAMKAGAFDFLEKPADHWRLLQTVEAAFARLDAGIAVAEARERALAQIASLSRRERDVLLALIDGRSNKAIAYQLSLSPRTVEIHRARMMAKLNVGSLPEALRIAFEAGLIDHAPARRDRQAHSEAA